MIKLIYSGVLFRRQFPQYASGNRPRNRKRRQVMFYQPKTTWTATFYLLPCKSHKTPAAAEQQKHLLAGLGRRKIVFDNKEGDHDYLISVLEVEFPKLKKLSFAFTLYKCQSGGSGCRPLEKIPMGPAGYTIPWLKDNCRLGSACIYINPIQDTLSVDPISPENVSLYNKVS